MKALYASVAEDYWQHGWQPFPLPVREKKQPPSGVTGHKGRDVTEEDVKGWMGSQPALSNVGLRMPDNVVGIDVDDYLADDGTRKVGGATLADLEADLGPLPPTTVSSSRFAAFPESGIRFYIVPDAYDTSDWPTGAGKDVDIIRHGHRYAVVSPSVVKGRTYEWHDQRTGEAGVIPSVADLPELPTAWCEYLQPRAKVSGTESDEKSSVVAASHPYIRAALNNAYAELAGTRSGSRNDVLNKKAYSLGRLVAGTELTEAEVRQVLMEASRVNGYIGEEGERAAEETITSGLESGMEHPKGVPTVAVDVDAMLAMDDEDEAVDERTWREKEQERENEVALRKERARQYALRTIAAEEMAEARGPRVKQTAGQFAKVPPPASVIEDILAAEVNLLGGPSAAGKSLLARDWALSVASGEPWLGHTVTEPRHVLWIASEGMNDFALRWSTQPLWAKAEDGIFILDDPVNLVRGDDVDWLLDEYAAEVPGLVVFDVVYGMGMADDMGTKDVFPVINAMKRISREWGAATLALGHTGHNGDARRFRGTSSWRQLAAVEWHMGDRMLTCEKSKITNTSLHDHAYDLRYPEIDWLGTGFAGTATLSIMRDLAIEKDFTDYPDDGDSTRARRLCKPLGVSQEHARRLVREWRKANP